MQIFFSACELEAEKSAVETAPFDMYISAEERVLEWEQISRFSAGMNIWLHQGSKKQRKEYKMSAYTRGGDIILRQRKSIGFPSIWIQM